MKSYWSVPPDVLEDDRTLREWAKRSHAASARAATRSIRPRRPARPK
jgi:TfoX/Sxy family transcriptional regulator of competence genes